MQTKTFANLVLSAVLSLTVAGVPALAKKSAGSAGANATAASATTGKTPAAMQVQLTNVTQNVKQGDKATVAVQTEPGATVKITVTLKSGKSSNASLTPQKADAQGNASWTWTIAKNTSAGPINFTVNSSLKGKKSEATGVITVEKNDSASAAGVSATASGGKRGTKKGK